MRLICRVGSMTEFADILTDLIVVDLDDESLRCIERRVEKLILEHREDKDVYSTSYHDWYARFYVSGVLDDYVNEHDPDDLLSHQGYIIIDDNSELPEDPGISENEEFEVVWRLPELQTMDLTIVAPGKVDIQWGAYEGDMRIESSPVTFDKLRDAIRTARSKS